MRIWFDTEFWDTGCSIALLSIGMYREDGQTYYAEVEGAPWPQIHASTGENERWLVENVLPHFTGPSKPRQQIADEIVAFCGQSPEFWAYVAAYDWVTLNQLYGPLVDRPKGWPTFCRDVKQLLLDAGGPWVPKQVGTEHNALDDAMWAHVAWTVAKGLDEFPPDLEHEIACVGRARVYGVAARFGYENGVRLPNEAWWRFVEIAKAEDLAR